MITLPTRHTPDWLPRPTALPPAPFLEESAIWLVPGFQLRIVQKSDSSLGQTLLFFSDLHWPPPNPQLYKILSLVINALEVDWIICCGDACTYLSNLPDALKWLASLKANQGKIALLGNRESCVRWKQPSQWAEHFKTAGYTLLCNSLLDAGAIRFYGIHDPRYGTPDWSPLMPSSAFTISLSHSPDGFADAPSGTYLGNLGLCGHTHAGQYALPLVGPIYSSSAYGRQFVHNWQQRNDGFPLFTAAGIGEAGHGILKHRLYCPRELLLLKL